MLINPNSLAVSSAFINLNTSHVNVNQDLYIKNCMNLLYLNTSHVNVNQIKDLENVCRDLNLNTSHVNVNLHIFLFLQSRYVLFKYISC